MFSVDAHTRVYIAAEPADFRKQINGLSLIVQEVLDLDPFSAHLFVFTNRGRDKLKLLYWHHNGFVLLCGRFVWPRQENGQPVCLTLRELTHLLEGGDVATLAPITQLKAVAV